MNWFKQHTDTALVLGAILSAVLWMNGQFNDARKNMNELKCDMMVMKTVMVMKGIMPTDVATNKQ